MTLSRPEGRYRTGPGACRSVGEDLFPAQQRSSKLPEVTCVTGFSNRSFIGYSSVCFGLWVWLSAGVLGWGRLLSRGGGEGGPVCAPLGWPPPSAAPPLLCPTAVIGAGPRVPFGRVGVWALVRRSKL